MAVFKMIKYHKQQYPSNIPIRIEETAGHFDVKSINPRLQYSLHTEYSYGKRSFANDNLDGLNTIISANKKGVPQLWKSKAWAEEFAEYIIRITKDYPELKVIEIHPPFDDYTAKIKDFVDIYSLFENIIIDTYFDIEFHIENRCGSIYSGGNFLISSLPQISELCEHIEKENLKLKIAFDIPQLYTAHLVTTKKKHLITELLQETISIRNHIGGIHLWGKKLSDSGRKVAHNGDLNTYFNNDIELKNSFLAALIELFNDGVCRNLVLEVNSSSDDNLSIIKDLDTVGFKYI